MSKPVTKVTPVHRHPAVWLSRIKLKWPILVWLAAVAGAWWLYQNQGPPTAFVGVVHVEHEAIAPLAAARVLDVPVQLGDRVEAGQVVARIEPEPLSADPTLDFDVLRIERQFVQFVQDAENSLQEAEIERARNEAELGALAAELDRLESLRAQGLVDDEVLARVRVPKLALQKMVDLYPDYIAQLEGQLNEARKQYEATRSRISAAGLQVTGEVGELELRSLQAGTVSQVPAAPGSVVQGGDPVVQILTDGEPFVLGYVHEAQTLTLTVGQTLYLQAAGGTGEWSPGTVTAVSPGITPLPVQFQRMPGNTVRGRQVVIRPEGEFLAAPGERVNISLAAGKSLF